MREKGNLSCPTCGRSRRKIRCKNCKYRFDFETSRFDPNCPHCGIKWIFDNGKRIEEIFPGLKKKKKKKIIKKFIFYLVILGLVTLGYCLFEIEVKLNIGWLEIYFK